MSRFFTLPNWKCDRNQSPSSLLFSSRQDGRQIHPKTLYKKPTPQQPMALILCRWHSQSSNKLWRICCYCIPTRDNAAAFVLRSSFFNYPFTAHRRHYRNRILIARKLLPRVCVTRSSKRIFEQHQRHRPTGYNYEATHGWAARRVLVCTTTCWTLWAQKSSSRRENHI